jgi:hypothetical protein
MRAARKLAVKREALGELSTDELGSVAGGTQLSFVVNPCPSYFIGGCPTRYGPICDTVSAAVANCPTRVCG